MMALRGDTAKGTAAEGKAATDGGAKAGT